MTVVDPLLPEVSEEAARPLLSLVVPAYNEALLLMRSLTTLYDYLRSLRGRYRFELLIVNDGSKDETGAIAETFAAGRPEVRVLHNPVNFRLGEALRRGIATSLGDYVVTFDSDLSYAPEHIERMVEALREQHARIVVASPYAKDGQTTAIPWRREMMSRAANKILAVSSSHGVTTVTGMVRAYDGPFVRSLNLKAMGPEINAEILYKAQVLRARVIEVPAHLDWSEQSERMAARKVSLKVSATSRLFLFASFLFRPVGVLRRSRVAADGHRRVDAGLGRDHRHRPVRQGVRRSRPAAVRRLRRRMGDQAAVVRRRRSGVHRRRPADQPRSAGDPGEALLRGAVPPPDRVAPPGQPAERGVPRHRRLPARSRAPSRATGGGTAMTQATAALFRRSSGATATSPTIAVGPTIASGEPAGADALQTLGRVALCAGPAIAVTAWLARRAGDRPMTMDESFTVLTSGRSWSSLIRGCITDPGMAVYYVILKGWALLVGASLGDLRMFSVVAVGVAALGAAWLGVRRRRPVTVGLALLAAALSPLMREAAADARAASLGAAAAIWLLVLFDLIGLDRPHRWGLRAAIVGSLGLAYIHPSTLFLGAAGVVLGWRTARRAGLDLERRLAIGTGVVLVLGAASATIKSGVTIVARPGWEGVGHVLSELPGGRTLAGIAVLATASVLLAGCSFDREPVIRWFGGSALAWFGLLALAVPVRNLYVPRYFAAAAMLVVVAIAFARIERWAVPMTAALLGIAILGGLEQLDTEYGYGSTWCDVADSLAESSRPGDTVVFGVSGYQSPVIACLGAQAEPVLGRGPTQPTLSADLYDDPRALWFNSLPDADAVLRIEPGQSTRYVWVEGADPQIDEAIDVLAAAGARCDRVTHGDVQLATCRNP